jgi:hypothetical protein
MMLSFPSALTKLSLMKTQPCILEKIVGRIDVYPMRLLNG